MISNKAVSVTQQLGLTELFRRKAKDAGPYSQYWLKCADIAARLDAGKPVGNYRRRRRTRHATGKGAGQ